MYHTVVLAAAAHVAHIKLLGNAHCLVSAVTVEKDHIVKIGTCELEFTLLQTGAYEVAHGIVIQSAVGFRHFRGLYAVEPTDGGAPRIPLPVFLLQVEVPTFCGFVYMFYVVRQTLYVGVQFRYLLLGFLKVELQYAAHPDFPEFHQVVVGDVAYKVRFERLHQYIDTAYGCFHVRGSLHHLVLVHPFGDEYFFQ